MPISNSQVLPSGPSDASMTAQVQERSRSLFLLYWATTSSKNTNSVLFRDTEARRRPRRPVCRRFGASAGASSTNRDKIQTTPLDLSTGSKLLPPGYKAIAPGSMMASPCPGSEVSLDFRLPIDNRSHPLPMVPCGGQHRKRRVAACAVKILTPPGPSPG